MSQEACRTRRQRLTAAGVALGLAVGLALPAWGVAGEDPAGEVTQALRGLGAPGLVWGRLLVEEESPEGAWTPLAGVEVTLYPMTPSLLAELERIRQSARTTGPQYESAASRLQAALAAHQARVDAQSAGTALARLKPDPASDPAAYGMPGAAPRMLDEGRALDPGPPIPPMEGKAEGARKPGIEGVASPSPLGKHPFQQTTDPAGLFVFTGVPAGDWAVLAIRVAPYEAQKLRAEIKPRASSRAQHFTGRATGGPPKEVEFWLGRVRLAPEERASLILTDRARWFVGPIR